MREKFDILLPRGNSVSMSRMRKSKLIVHCVLNNIVAVDRYSRPARGNRASLVFMRLNFSKSDRHGCQFALIVKRNEMRRQSDLTDPISHDLGVQGSSTWPPGLAFRVQLSMYLQFSLLLLLTNAFFETLCFENAFSLQLLDFLLCFLSSQSCI